jgi:4-hydroxy-tetrahydrodipicolinate reductase
MRAEPMTDPMRLVVVGAGGRMGRALVRAVSESPDAVVHAAIEHEASPLLGQDSGMLAGLSPNGIPVTSDALGAFVHAHGVLDFTAPAATFAFAELSAQARLVHVVGTTGLADADLDRLDAAARHAVIIRSGNFSLGVNMLAALVRRAAAALKQDWDIEIVEAHHRHKVDAPSGTALMLGHAAAAGRGVDLNAHMVSGRDGITGPRDAGSIGFSAIRGGDIVGEHDVIFAAMGERVVLRHIATDRAIFARGALKAAIWGQAQKPARYDMMDVLGL